MLCEKPDIFAKTYEEVVLILVLMEDALRVDVFFYINSLI